MFENNFDKVLADADNLWMVHKKRKGDSWKSMSFDVIANLVKEEYHEWRGRYRDTLKAVSDNRFEEEGEFEEMQYQELLDLINVCLIAAEKLRKERSLKRYLFYGLVLL